MSETRDIVKVSLQITCQLLWLVGMVMGLSGVYLLLNFKHNGLFFRDFFIILPAVMAIASAVFLLSSGAIGCCVSVRSSTWLQGVFVYLLVVIFCLEATAAALAYISSGKVNAELAPFQDIFQKYNGSSEDPDTNAVNSLQTELQCCGITDYRDWLNTPWFRSTGQNRVPQSCCFSAFHTCNGTLDQPYMLYPQGCRVKLEDGIVFVLHVILYSSAAATVVLIVGLVSVAQLMIKQPQRRYQILIKQALN